MNAIPLVRGGQPDRVGQSLNERSQRGAAAFATHREPRSRDHPTVSRKHPKLPKHEKMRSSASDEGPGLDISLIRRLRRRSAFAGCHEPLRDLSRERSSPSTGSLKNVGAIGGASAISRRVSASSMIQSFRSTKRDARCQRAACDQAASVSTREVWRLSA